MQLKLKAISFISTLFVFIFLSPLESAAQSSASWWYFGVNAGMHFLPSGPVADTNGQLNTMEGCSSVSDDYGNLLFYTDGSVVYDANHDTMPNGTGLLGHSSSNQSSLVVPFPDHPEEYFIFTVDWPNMNDGMNYTKVDMTLNGGLGDVVVPEKNIQLFEPTCEKVSATAHANGTDYWVAGYKAGTDSIFTILVDQSGVGEPQYAGSGSHVTQNIISWQSGMKFSPDGNYLAVCQEFEFTVDLFKFNNQTGMLSDRIEIVTDSSGWIRYSVEFSPSSQVLYSSGRGGEKIYQYDLSLYDSTFIANSTYVVDSVSSQGTIQLGPDLKIYCSASGQGYVSRINNPNLLGFACNWQDSAVYLDGRTCFLGLPDFIQSNFSVPITPYYKCLGDTTIFVFDTTGIDSAHWDYGDPSTGNLNTDTTLFASHVFSSSGQYTVTAYLYSTVGIDTIDINLNIYPLTEVNLGPDLSLCYGDSATIGDTIPGVYTWSNGVNSRSLTIYEDTNLILSVKGGCNTDLDSIVVSFSDSVIVNLPPDTTLCVGEAIAASGNAEYYVWNTGDTAEYIIPAISGEFEVTGFGSCDTAKDSVLIYVKFNPSFSLPDDTILCSAQPIDIDLPTQDDVVYVWNSTDTTNLYTLIEARVYTLVGFNNCDTLRDSIEVVHQPPISADAKELYYACENEMVELGFEDSTYNYIWSTGDLSQTIQGIIAGSPYTVTISDPPCYKTLEFSVLMDSSRCTVQCKPQIPNVITVDGDGLNDVFSIRTSCKLWSSYMIIYNRWGQKIYEAESINNAWDGYIAGQPATEGTYYYVIELKTSSKAEKPTLHRGYFTLFH